MCSGVIIKILISVTLSLLLLLGAHDLIVNVEPNRCEMTYMYQYPEYIKVKTLNHSQMSFPNYELFVYGEGNYAHQLKKKIYNGIPVLFIPGNAGSHKQVRSLASVAYKMAADHKLKIHLNFFSVDLNEDYGGFFGPVLEKQTQYVSLCIKTIMALYDNAKVKPSSVILVTHSVGGIVARAVSTLPDFSASNLPLIITLSSPIRKPVLISDPIMLSFYNNVNDYWTRNQDNVLNNTLLISISAGRNDILVAESLSFHSMVHLQATTMSTAGCWLSTDHLAVLWCRQLVLAIVRGLFDSIDANKGSLTRDREKILSSFSYQLLERSGSKYSFDLGFPATLHQLENKGHWSEVLKRQFQKEFIHQKSDYFLMIPLFKENPHYNYLAVVATEIEWRNWIFACNANVVRKNTKLCSFGENLSGRGRVIPEKRKEILLHVDDLIADGHTHVVVWIQPNDNKVSVNVDMNNGRERLTTLSLPPILQSALPLVIIDKTPSAALTYNLTVSGLNEAWQAYNLLIEPLHCASQMKPTVSLKSSWASRWDYMTPRFDGKDYKYPLEVSVLPLVANKTDAVFVHIVFEQGCSYKICIESNMIGVFRKLILHYGSQIFSFVVCHFLLVLALQFKSLAGSGKSPSPISAVLKLSPIVVVPFVKILSFILSKVDVPTDPALLVDQGLQLEVLPIFLFLAFLPFSILFSLSMWLAVVVSGKSAQSFASKILKRAIRSGDMITDMVAVGIFRLPVAIGAAIAAIGSATCGGVGLLLAAGFYFVKIFKFYEDYLEHLLWSLVPGSKESTKDEDRLSSINIHFTLMMLQFLAALFHLPVVVAWIKNNGPESHLPSDSSLGVSFVCILSLSFLWQFGKFSAARKYYKQLGYLIHLAAVCVILFGSVTLYRVTYIIGFVLAAVTLHQLLSPIEKDEEDSGSSKIISMRIVNEEATSNPSDHSGVVNEEGSTDSNSSSFSDDHDSSN